MQFRNKRLQAVLSWLPILAAVVFAGASAARDVVVDPYHDYRDEVERGEYQYDDSNDIPWIENESEVLALPKKENLYALNVDALPPGFELLIDRSRISVDPRDRVVRVWLWLHSEAGAESATFEGFRCETREYKVYAYANPRRDPPVSKARRPRWLAVREIGQTAYRAELLSDYFCGIRGTRDADQIRNAMTGEFQREHFMSE